MDFKTVLEYLNSETVWTVKEKLAIWIVVVSLTFMTMN